MSKYQRNHQRNHQRKRRNVRDMGPRDRARTLSQKLIRQNEAWTQASVHDASSLGIPEGRSTEVIYRVTNDESFQAATEYNNPLVLVFASNFKPGGGFLNGVTHTQEENLCCRSTLYEALESQGPAYPLAQKLIYVPYVRVFADQKLQLLKRSHRFTVSCVASAAPKNPRVDGGHYTNAKNRTDIRKQIRGMLNLAHEHKHDAIIIGAWGCGVYRNPPGEIVNAYKAEIDQTSFSGEIVFSVFGAREFNELITQTMCGPVQACSS